MRRDRQAYQKVSVSEDQIMMDVEVPSGIFLGSPKF